MRSLCFDRSIFRKILKAATYKLWLGLTLGGMMLKRFLQKRYRKKFSERTYRDMPGYSVRSVDDLRFQVLEFEKLVKNYIESKTGVLPKGTLHHLIEKILPNYPLYPKFESHWPAFIDEAKILKEFRNNIIHSDFDGLPPVSELFDRFNKANETLLPFKICSASRERFKPIRWVGDVLEIKIDENLYKLEPEDITNLIIELHPACRGHVHFIKGKIVESKVLDYLYEKVTYFIEGFPEFELSHDESMVLEDLLHSLVGRRMYGE